MHVIKKKTQKWNIKQRGGGGLFQLLLTVSEEIDISHAIITGIDNILFS